MTRFFTFYLCTISTIFTQSDPTPTNPPHNCENYGLCSPFVNWNTTYLECPASQCVCQPGTTGPACATIIDKCNPNPCPSGNFVCSSGISSPACTCSPGFTGTNCDAAVGSVCASQPCENGGTCSSKDNTTFTCKCASGFIPPDCKYSDPCGSNPCGSHGKCSAIWDGADFLCTCDFDYMGRNCESRDTTWNNNQPADFACYPYDPVIDDPTKYKKIIDNKMSYSTCFNLLRTTTLDRVIYTSFVVMENSCYLTAGNYLNSTGPNLFNKLDTDCYKTCPGNKGEQCGKNGKRIVWGLDNDTTTQPDTCAQSNKTLCDVSSGNGVCISVSKDVSKSGFQCSCKPGYKLNNTKTGCEAQTDPCLTTTCQHNGTCVPTADNSNATCDCLAGYNGPLCQYTQQCNPNPCKYGGTCEDLQNGSFKCHCLPLFEFATCNEINACSYANPCKNGDCSDLGTGIQVRPQCKCKNGWTGKACDTEINYCTVKMPCQYNGTCTPKFGDYTCSCIKGVDGKNCENIINNCVEYKDENGNKYPTRCNTKDKDAFCVNAINSFSCNCSAMWRGTYCDMNVIIEDVMITLFGKVNWDLLPLLNNLLLSPAAINSMVPFILGTLSLSQRTSLSWDYSDMFYWATYEEKELDVQKDFYKWNDVVLGNCFTFNHINATRFYKYRSSKSEGGLKVRMKINQAEYEPWTETAAMMIFIHNAQDYVFSESIRYNAEPNSEVLIYPYANEYTRLGGRYGRCVNTPDEVKSYYYPGSYTSDGCYRSCYQDLILQSCKCMDPRYPMPDNSPSCIVTDMSCIDETTAKYGDPSTWNFCSCPVPCENENYAVDWTKTNLRVHTPNCISPSSNAYDDVCQSRTQDSVIITVSSTRLTYSLFQETPSMDINRFIGNLGGLLGVLMGIGAITIAEIGVMIFRVCNVICCFEKVRARREKEALKKEQAAARRR